MITQKEPIDLCYAGMKIASQPVYLQPVYDPQDFTSFFKSYLSRVAIVNKNYLWTFRQLGLRPAELSALMKG